MNLDVDKQTLNDLAIFQFGNNRQSVFNLFCKTTTIGGKEALEDIFAKPLNDRVEIKERIEVFKYIEQLNLKISLDKNDYDFVEFYLKKPYQSKSFSVMIGFIEKIIYAFNNNNDYYIIQRGVESMLSVFESLLKYADELKGDLPKKLEEIRLTILNTFQAEELLWVRRIIEKTNLTAIDLAKTDNLFRNVAPDRMKLLLNVAYQLDVYQSVGSIGRNLGFSYPVINDGMRAELSIQGLFHPFIADAKSNDISFSPDKNVCFITGTNMAGKSSLLKSIGISVYLSQLGFPVRQSIWKPPPLKS